MATVTINLLGSAPCAHAARGQRMCSFGPNVRVPSKAHMPLQVLGASKPLSLSGAWRWIVGEQHMSCKLC